MNAERGLQGEPLSAEEAERFASRLRPAWEDSDVQGTAVEELAPDLVVPSDAAEVASIALAPATRVHENGEALQAAPSSSSVPSPPAPILVTPPPPPQVLVAAPPSPPSAAPAALRESSSVGLPSVLLQPEDAYDPDFPTVLLRSSRRRGRIYLLIGFLVALVGVIALALTSGGDAANSKEGVAPKNANTAEAESVRPGNAAPAETTAAAERIAPPVPVNSVKPGSTSAPGPPPAPDPHGSHPGDPLTNTGERAATGHPGPMERPAAVPQHPHAIVTPPAVPRSPAAVTPKPAKPVFAPPHKTPAPATVQPKASGIVREVPF